MCILCMQAHNAVSKMTLWILHIHLASYSLFEVGQCEIQYFLTRRYKWNKRFIAVSREWSYKLKLIFLTKECVDKLGHRG